MSMTTYRRIRTQSAYTCYSPWCIAVPHPRCRNPDCRVFYGRLLRDGSTLYIYGPGRGSPGSLTSAGTPGG